MSIPQPSPKTLKLLLDHEVGGGKAYYDKYLSKFTWPGGASGPTIAIGIDVAYYTADQLKTMFSFLSESSVRSIQKGVGKTGERGKEYAKILKNEGITVSWEKAVEIFEQITWPKFAALAESTFPGLRDLHPDAYGAIVSLVFNRGSQLTGDRRIEMRAIKDLVPKKDYKGIAAQFRKMKRLWEGKGLDGLLRRREEEARLIESCATSV